MNNVNSYGEFFSRLMQVGGASCVFLSFGHCFYTPNTTANGQHSNISAAWRLRTCYAILKQSIKEVNIFYLFWLYFLGPLSTFL